MRSTAFITVALSAAVAAGSLVPAQAASPTEPTATPLPALVKLSSCSRAERSALFYARMRRTEPGERMRMRFTLLERGAEGSFEPVRAPGLGRWHRSRPGVAAFGYRQRVRNLTEGSAYRALVSFRWYGEDGQLVRRASRQSRACRQFSGLPDLRTRIVGSSATSSPGVRRYSVRVSNAGLSTASDVDLLLQVDGSPLELKTVSQLAPGQVRLVSFRGPECRGGVEATVDPDGTVREAHEGDNVHALACTDLPSR